MRSSRGTTLRRAGSSAAALKDGVEGVEVPPLLGRASAAICSRGRGEVGASVPLSTIARPGDQRLRHLADACRACQSRYPEIETVVDDLIRAAERHAPADALLHHGSPTSAPRDTFGGGCDKIASASARGDARNHLPKGQLSVSIRARLRRAVRRLAEHPPRGDRRERPRPSRAHRVDTFSGAR